MNDAMETFEYLVSEIYRECVGNGYTKSGSIGKIKYELLPMAKTENEKAFFYFELTHLAAKENLTTEFATLYDTHQTYMEGGIINVLIQASEPLKEKQKVITAYAEQLKY